MILLIHDNDASTIEFLSYLKSESTSKNHIVDLSIKNIINEVKIIDKIFEKNTNSDWTFFSKKISFSNISTIYNRIKWLDMELFNDYIEEDRAYVQNEWWAYLVYRVNNIPNALNHYTKEILAGQFYQFTFQYLAADKNGINTPQYIVSNDSEKLQNFALKNPFITRSSLYENFDFRRSESISKETFALVEYVEGNSCIVHVIEDRLFATLITTEGKKLHNIDITLAENCLKLAKQLELKVMEIFFKINKEGLYYLYYISPYPNWLYNHSENKSKIYRQLSQMFLKYDSYLM